MVKARIESVSPPRGGVVLVALRVGEVEARALAEGQEVLLVPAVPTAHPDDVALPVVLDAELVRERVADGVPGVGAREALAVAEADEGLVNAGIEAAVGGVEPLDALVADVARVVEDLRAGREGEGA